MGKKVKVGKARKDKFYQLAKESGYRSRAAFKLLQLNRTYHFLEKSRVCVDLCAAPGGWLQVAATNMPVSSIIIGVDLAPIKPIGNVITHVEDITTAKCLQTLRKDLNEMKADVVLHDGAPNVGKNWIHDAYQQNLLVLQSFKLATELLKKGGYFVTKVFRSKDYYSLLWVLQQFFKKVEATKPQASRNESAEIFVVCQNYKAPDKIDPKFFDLKFVFSEVDTDNMMRSANDLFKDDMNKRHRGGYPDNDYTLYHRLNASDFVQKENFLELLANTNEIVLDDKAIAEHPATTAEIKECVKDIRILGKNDIKVLLKWRLQLRGLYKVKKSEVEKLKNAEAAEATNGKGANGTTRAEGEEPEEEDIDAEIKDALDSEKKWEKKKKKKLLKEKQKFNKKVDAKLELKDDQIDFHLQGDNELFNLNKIKTNKQLIELQRTLPDLDLITNADLDDEDEMFGSKKRQKKSFAKDESDLGFLESSLPAAKKKTGKKAGESEGEEEEASEFEFSDDETNLNEDLLNGDDDEDDANPLLDDLTNGDRKQAKESVTSQWFNKESFDFLDSKEEENEELLRELERLEEEPDAAPAKSTKAKKQKKDDNMERFDGREEEDEAASRALNGNDDSDSDSDTDTDEEEQERAGKKRKKGRKSQAAPSDAPGKKLSPVELALGEVITNSKKAKRDLLDESFNRYSGFGQEEELPEWFAEDEEKNFRKPVVVPKEILNDYRAKDDKINARAIKKVVEAQARKKRRLSKKLDRARKKAEAISDNADMTENERVKEMKAVYKRAGLLSKKKADIKYVVGKRGMSTKGLAKSGPYRIVDPRLKKDRRAQRKRPRTKKQAHKKTSNRKTARKQR